MKFFHIIKELTLFPMLLIAIDCSNCYLENCVCRDEKGLVRVICSTDKNSMVKIEGVKDLEFIKNTVALSFDLIRNLEGINYQFYQLNNF